jgi:hypothetical protein
MRAKKKSGTRAAVSNMKITACLLCKLLKHHPPRHRSISAERYQHIRASATICADENAVIPAESLAQPVQ